MSVFEALEEEEQSHEILCDVESDPIVILIESPDELLEGDSQESLIEGEPGGPAPEPTVQRDEQGRLVVSLEAIEAEIQRELGLEGRGGRELLSMTRLFKVLAVVALGLLALILVVGWPYYCQPASVRPFHHLHSLLRPSGALGLSMGVLGALLMASSLLYLVRKRFPTLGRWGSLPSWLGFHILTGLLGPAIAMFHTAFLPTSALGFLAIGAAILVVASGVIGRYIAVYFPRSLGGRELRFEEVRGRLIIYRRKLVGLGVDPALLRIDTGVPRRRSPWVLSSICRVVYGDWESRREVRRLRQLLAERGELRLEMEMILFLIRRLCWERQWVVRYGEFRRLVGTWRFLHRWMAVILMVAVAFHVVVGIRYGGLWLLGGRG